MEYFLGFLMVNFWELLFLLFGLGVAWTGFYALFVTLQGDYFDMLSDETTGRLLTIGGTREGLRGGLNWTGVINWKNRWRYFFLGLGGLAFGALCLEAAVRELFRVSLSGHLGYGDYSIVWIAPLLAVALFFILYFAHRIFRPLLDKGYRGAYRDFLEAKEAVKTIHGSQDDEQLLGIVKKFSHSRDISELAAQRLTSEARAELAKEDDVLLREAAARSMALEEKHLLVDMAQNDADSSVRSTAQAILESVSRDDGSNLAESAQINNKNIDSHQFYAMERREELLWLTCQMCGAEYRVGFDAIAATSEGMLSEILEMGGSVSAGKNADLGPDLVKYGAPNTEHFGSVVEEAKLIMACIIRREPRQWQCGYCRAVNSYYDGSVHF